jgi:riboflavin kinase/FMN adenylyltransferase
MTLFQHPQSPEIATKAKVLAIGNFDGVHRGHHILLSKAIALSKTMKMPCGVLTFEPHPRAIFRPDDPPFRITPEPLKSERLTLAGVDAVVTLNFDWDFASLSAEDFIHNILKEKLNAAHIVVGADFCFGQLRKGSPQTIIDSGLPVTIVEKAADAGGEILSSSRIRQCLRSGDIAAANAVLGWDWEMRGVVVKGDQRGRELGYPTANVALGATIHPAYGVYAAYVRVEGQEIWRPAATNIGIRPMYALEVAQVETFIFDFDGDLYGKTLHVRPVKRLRGEAKFASVDELLVQMKKDCDQARNMLT